MLNMDSSPNPQLLLIGSGILYVNEFDSNGVLTGGPNGYLDMGLVSSIEPQNSDTRFQKYEIRTRYRALYADLLLRRNTEIKVNFDEVNATVLEMWLQGTRSDIATQAATAVTGEAMTGASGAVLGRSYQLAKTGPISALVITNETQSAPVDADDIEISDINVPIVRILPTATSVDPGDVLTAAYTPTATTEKGVQIDIGTRSIVRAALRFIGDPPSGPRLQVDWWKSSVRPEGVLPLLTTTDENTPLSMTFTVESDPVGHAQNPIGRVRQLPN